MADEPNNPESQDEGQSPEEQLPNEPQDQAEPTPPEEASESPVEPSASSDAESAASAEVEGSEQAVPAEEPSAVEDAVPPDGGSDDDGVEGNTLSQEELDALAAQAGGEPQEDEAAEAKPQTNTIDQAELDALAAELGETVGSTAPKKTVTPGKGMTQEDVEALASELAAGAADAGAAGDADDPIAAAMAEAIAAEAGGQAAAPEEPRVVGSTPVRVDPEEAQPFEPSDLSSGENTNVTTIDMLDDVELDVKIELGRTDMYIEDVLRLGVGSVVELDKLAGDPVDIFVNDRLIARGEVLVLNDNFCVRINDIHSPIPELDAE